MTLQRINRLYLNSMSESMTEGCGCRNTWTKNGQRKGSKTELFLTGMYVLHMGTCMFVRLATSGKESGTIKRKLSDEVLNN